MSMITPSVSLVCRTQSGEVRGAIAGGVRAWFGIPYAQAPVGALRFRAPRPPLPWQGVRDAQAFGPLPVQKRGFEAIGGAGRRTPMSEDCLTVNVSAPATPSDRPRPVVVWIYGGGFSLGGTRTPLYRGDDLVAQGDVVFVSFNYRVGAFGFSDFSRWSTADSTIESNLGLRDQVAALQWVQQNIAAFGGDPGNVTLFGQSAGAASVVFLMGLPAARGLFHRAFAMSPSAFSVYGPERHAVFAEEIVRMLGLAPDEREATGRALKALDAEQLNAVAARFFYDVAPDRYPGYLPTSPVIDGDFLPCDPVEAFREGRAARVPLVIGTMKREGAMLHKALPVISTRVRQLEAEFSRGAPDDLWHRLAGAYPGFPSRATAIDAGGDFSFWLPTLRIAEAHSRFADCWVYRFDYATPLTRLVFGAATHGLDLPMIFGSTGQGELGLLDLFSRRASKAVSERFQTAFLEFAHGRSPGWSRYDAEHRRTRIIDKQDREEQDPGADVRRAWGDCRGPV